MKKPGWVVRITYDSIVPEGSFSEGRFRRFIESLRYAQLAEVHEESNKVFDLIAPRGLDSKIWATQNAERMESQGLNAVAAPAWEE